LRDAAVSGAYASGVRISGKDVLGKNIEEERKRWPSTHTARWC